MNRPEAESILAEVKSHPGLLVLHGYADCSPEDFWLLDMTGPEFEKWWQDREEFWWPVTPQSQEDYLLLASILETQGPPPPLRPPMVLPGKFLPGQFEEYGDSDLLSSLWKSLYESNRHYYCQICCDGDSFLRTPDGRRIYHKASPDRKL